MESEVLTVPVGTSTVRLLRAKPVGTASDLALVYAPGAGSSLYDPFGAHLAQVLPKQGIEIWRLEFPYMAAGRKRPDAPALLLATWQSVLEKVTEEAVGPIAIGGRSMGGRIASMLVAEGAPVQGLALFAYPLIPPGSTSVARTEHLPRIRVPALFCSGSRDSFGTPAQLAEAAALVPSAELHVLEGADHGFNTLKSSGRTRQDVWDEATAALLDFLARLPVLKG